MRASSKPRPPASWICPRDVTHFTACTRTGFTAGRIYFRIPFGPFPVIPRAVFPLREFLDTCRIKEGSE
jgi:hypothetical protein